MSSRGKKIVLAASTSESSESQNSTRRQMPLGTLPPRYSRFPFYMIGVNRQNEPQADGQAATSSSLDEPSKLAVPETVEIPQTKARPAIPELAELT